MAYENPFLEDFSSIFFAVLKEKEISPEKMELIIFDEEPKIQHMFERTDVEDVLNQLSEDLNALTIYTDRPAFFCDFAEKMYEETGLLVRIISKQERKRTRLMQTQSATALILDFEWEGACNNVEINSKCSYIPIHKKAWKVGENLDILVPFGYNTVIVKKIPKTDKKFARDRFEEGFYKSE